MKNARSHKICIEQRNAIYMAVQGSDLTHTNQTRINIYESFFGKNFPLFR